MYNQILKRGKREPKRLNEDLWGWKKVGQSGAPNTAHCEDIEHFCFGCTHSSTHSPSKRG